MSTSVRVPYIRRALWQLGWTAFLAFFGAVYEHFGHGVYSPFMIYAFALPLSLGALPWCALALKPRRAVCEGAARLWDSGVLTLAVGACSAACWTSSAPPTGSSRFIRRRGPYCF